MSVYKDPNAPRFFTWGTRVDKAAGTLPQTATATLFTVAGGRVLVTSIVGQVTVALGAVVTTVKLTSTPTTGTAVDLTTAVAVTSAEAGALLTLPATALGALNVAATNSGAIAAPLNYGLIIPPGVISWTTSANDTGQVKWSLTYIPFDDGAVVS